MKDLLNQPLMDKHGKDFEERALANILTSEGISGPNTTKSMNIGNTNRTGDS